MAMSMAASEDAKSAELGVRLRALRWASAASDATVEAQLLLHVKAHSNDRTQSPSQTVHIDWLCVQYCGLVLGKEYECDEDRDVLQVVSESTALPDETKPAPGRTCFLASPPEVVAAGLTLKQGQSERYHFRASPPPHLPPSFVGRTVRVEYAFVVSLRTMRPPTASEPGWRRGQLHSLRLPVCVLLDSAAPAPCRVTVVRGVPLRRCKLSAVQTLAAAENDANMRLDASRDDALHESGDACAATQREGNGASHAPPLTTLFGARDALGASAGAAHLNSGRLSDVETESALGDNAALESDSDDEDAAANEGELPNVLIKLQGSPLACVRLDSASARIGGVVSGQVRVCANDYHNDYHNDCANDCAYDCANESGAHSGESWRCGALSISLLLEEVAEERSTSVVGKIDVDLTRTLQTTFALSLPSHLPPQTSVLNVEVRWLLLFEFDVHGLSTEAAPPRLEWRLPLIVKPIQTACIRSSFVEPLCLDVGIEGRDGS